MSIPCGFTHLKGITKRRKERIRDSSVLVVISFAGDSGSPCSAKSRGSRNDNRRKAKNKSLCESRRRLRQEKRALAHSSMEEPQAQQAVISDAEELDGRENSRGDSIFK